MRPEHQAKLSRSMDRVFGERMRFVPMSRRGYLAAAADPSRASVEVVGVVLHTSRAARPRGDEALKGSKAWAQMERFFVSVPLAQFADGPLPQKSDQVELIERPGLPIMRVESVEPAISGRIHFRLTKVDAPPEEPPA